MPDTRGRRPAAPGPRKPARPSCADRRRWSGRCRAPSRLTSEGDSSCRLSARSRRPATVWPPSSVGRPPRSRTLTAPSRSIHGMTTPLQTRFAGPAGPGLRRLIGRRRYQPGGAYWINHDAAQTPAARRRAGTGPASSWIAAGRGLLTASGSSPGRAAVGVSHDVALFPFRMLFRPPAVPTGLPADQTR